MQFVLKNILDFMPLIFGIGFLGPVLVQIIEMLGWHAPFGLSSMALGMTIGGYWGIIAKVRGRWI